MTLLFQPKCDRRTGTLIDQKLHLCVLHLKRYEGCVLKSLHGKKKTCLNIFFSQSVIFLSNVGCGRSMREQIKNVVYWQPGAFDDGLAHHHFGINCYSCKQFFVFHCSSPIAFRDYFTTAPTAPATR